MGENKVIAGQDIDFNDPMPLFAPLPLRWKVHSSRLLNEVLSNSSTSSLRVPLNIFGKLLAAVGERAAELNDPRLNELMCRLTIYTVADPDSTDYDPNAVDKVSRLAREAQMGEEKL